VRRARHALIVDHRQELHLRGRFALSLGTSRDCYERVAGDGGRAHGQ